MNAQVTAPAPLANGSYAKARAQLAGDLRIPVKALPTRISGPIPQEIEAEIVNLYTQGIRPTRIADVLDLHILDVADTLKNAMLNRILRDHRAAVRDELEALLPAAVARLEDALKSTSQNAHRWAIDLVFKATGITGPDAATQTSSDKPAATLADTINGAIDALREQAITIRELNPHTGGKVLELTAKEILNASRHDQPQPSQRAERPPETGALTAAVGRARR